MEVRKMIINNNNCMTRKLNKKLIKQNNLKEQRQWEFLD
jgi:hypothetical protein